MVSKNERALSTAVLYVWDVVEEKEGRRQKGVGVVGSSNLYAVGPPGWLRVARWALGGLIWGGHFAAALGSVEGPDERRGKIEMNHQLIWARRG